MAIRRAWALAILVLAAALPAQSQSNGSIGVSPGTVDIADAQSGQSYHASVSVQNQYDEPTTFGIELNGTAGAWTATTPKSSFTVAAKSSQEVLLEITPPGGTGPGENKGELRFITEQKGNPTGAGAGFHIGVVVLLSVHVGGVAHVAVEWQNATSADVEVGEPLQAWTGVHNAGNVRTIAKATATANAFGDPRVAAAGNGSVLLEPGETKALAINLGAALAVGQYQIHIESIAPPGYNATVEAKIVPAGFHAPDGLLRAIRNEPRVKAGEPVTISAWFQNIGKSTIASARASAQVLSAGSVETTLGSDSQQVLPGAYANLTFVWTPAHSGIYRITGHVEYDGYKTPDAESRIEVATGAVSLPIFMAFMLAGIALIVGVIVFVRRRDRKRRPPAAS